MSGAESELIQFIEVVVSTAAVYCVGYSAGKSRGFVEAVKMAVIDGKAKVIVERKDRKDDATPQDPPGEPPPPPPPPGVCQYCGGKLRVLVSHKGHRVIVCNRCGPVNLVKEGGAE